MPMTPAAASAALAEHLLGDAAAQEAGNDDAIGRRYDALERKFPLGSTPELARLLIALTFWDAWIDARNRGWQSTDGIGEADWPRLAREIAADLTERSDLTDAHSYARFDASLPGVLNDRARMLAERLSSR